MRSFITAMAMLFTAGTACAQQPAVGGVAPNQRQTPAIDRRALATLIDSVMARGMSAEHIPGAVFTLVQDGRVVFVKGYGFDDVDAKRPVSRFFGAITHAGEASRAGRRHPGDPAGDRRLPSSG